MKWKNGRYPVERPSGYGCALKREICGVNAWYSCGKRVFEANFESDFFDSHYAAAALNLDRKVISFDKVYDRISGLARVKPSSV